MQFSDGVLIHLKMDNLRAKNTGTELVSNTTAVPPSQILFCGRATLLRVKQVSMYTNHWQAKLLEKTTQANK
jgi:hypothetical protein